MRCCMMRKLRTVVLALLWGMGLAPAMAAQTLHVDFMFSSGLQRTAWFQLLKRFESENPDIEVVRTEKPQEVYKQEFLKKLETQNTDVAFWFAGERLRQAAQRGLLRPIDPGFVRGTMKPHLVETAYQSAAVEGQVYGFPLKYYAWGFFYRKSHFRSLGLEVPQTWADFLHVCEVLQQSGSAPMAVGNKDGWPAAAWFDYLNLRTNGVEFHRKLLSGRQSFADPRVAKVFALWKELLTRSYFDPQFLDQPWDSALPLFYRNKVGMLLMGGSVIVKFPEVLKGDIGFFPFPRVDPKIKPYEEAPLDVLVLPRTGRNRVAAQRFLAFLSKTDALDVLNETLHTVSPRKQEGVDADPFIAAARAVLETSAGVTFYFDRDVREDLLAPALEAFRAYMLPPHDAQAAMQALETQRQLGVPSSVILKLRK